MTESIRSLSSRREDWIGATEEDLEGEMLWFGRGSGLRTERNDKEEELWFGRGSGLRTERNDKEEESERDGFDETPHIVVRLVQAIVLDLGSDRRQVFLFVQAVFWFNLIYVL